MSERWWVIENSQLIAALRRVAEGENSGIVYIELVANSRVVTDKETNKENE